ncbi:hypothetical protein SASPL_124497 [Salvia splendens]|uniref:Profilin n=1 Tax=Salvia splendens TaxID=180675 RepID=A0A8X8XFD6_SALSN|nr:hypothetical protein SASPL_124497 [Salvia splendens]
MSWQSYIDDHLMADVDGCHLTSSAIVGHDGSVWAQSSNFPQFKPEEVTAIMNDFDNPGSLAPTGLYIGGTKYMVIQGEPNAVIRGKKGSGGATIKKTNLALIIGIYDEPMAPGQCNMVVEKIVVGVVGCDRNDFGVSELEMASLPKFKKGFVFQFSGYENCYAATEGKGVSLTCGSYHFNVETHASSLGSVENQGCMPCLMENVRSPPTACMAGEENAELDLVEARSLVEQHPPLGLQNGPLTSGQVGSELAAALFVGSSEPQNVQKTATKQPAVSAQKNQRLRPFTPVVEDEQMLDFPPLERTGLVHTGVTGG